MKKLLIIFSLLCFVFTSCESEGSDDVNQNTIYTDYELFYDANGDKTYAIATFRFGNALGTPLELSGNNTITFNGDDLVYNPVTLNHRKEYAGYIAKGDFEYVNSNGNTFKNTAEFANVISHPTNIDTITRTGAFTYPFGGGALQAGEIASVTIGSDADALNLEVFINANPGSDNFILPLNQLNQLAIGPSYAQMDRQFEKPAAEANDDGGIIRTRYRAKNNSVYVK